MFTIKRARVVKEAGLCPVSFTTERVQKASSLTIKRASDMEETGRCPVFSVSKRVQTATVSQAHLSPLYIGALCALFFLSALPMVVRSEEENVLTAPEEVVAETAVVKEDETKLEGLYAVEGVPGGESVVGDFVVGPGKVDVTLKPGQTKIIDVLVTNRTGVSRIFNVSTEDAEGSKDPNTPIVLLGSDRGPYSIKDYLSVPHKRFKLGHNERARIPVTISIPVDAEPGGLYGSVLIDTITVDASGKDTDGMVPQSAVVARIGTLFFVTVPGEVERNGALKEFSTIAEKKFYQGGPIAFGILYENTGSMHLAPYGELRIKNMFDEEVGYLPLDPWFVLPQSLRLREVTWNRDALFGRYTATISINRSYNDTVDELSFTFWVLPWKPVAIAFTGLFITLFLIRAFFRRFEFKRK